MSVSKKQISVTEARDKVLERLSNELSNRIELIQNPSLISGPYWMLRNNIEGCEPSNLHCFYVRPEELRVGAARTICISKTTAEVVIDGKFGE